MQKAAGYIEVSRKGRFCDTKTGVSQTVAHNPEVGGSNPSPATRSVTVVDTISATVIFYLLPVWECFWNETGGYFEQIRP